MTASIPPITEDDIAHYLSNTPEFFERHADLLATVQLTSPISRRTVSLQERQAEMLRDKIRMLEMRIMDMIRHGNDNLALSDRLLRWSRELLSLSDLAVLPGHIASSVQQQFSVPQVALKLWGLGEAYAGLPELHGVSEEAKSYALSVQDLYCGVNNQFEVVQWLADPAQAASLALMPLRAAPDQEAFGMLVLASPDSQRYTSTMGTDFLLRLADMASAALARLRSTS
jgi:uncharacterized protein YigA (DUF484 family)